MKKILYIILISLFSLTVISCSKKDDSSSSSSSTTLSAPSGLTAAGAASQVTLDWTAVSGASSYTVYWDNSTGVSSSSTAITSVSTDNYTHSSLDNGTTYYYKVSAVDTDNTTGSLSSEVSAATPLPAPDNLSASGANNTITLTWNSVSGATSYTLYWDNVSGIDSSDTAITSITNDNYTHSNMDNGSTYYYKVAADDSAGTAGTLSSEVNATTYKYLSSTSTASGSITVGSETMSGVYATECITTALSTLISAGRVPSDTASYGFMTVVTGSDNISEESQFFTDSSCTTNSLLLKTQYDNVTVGSASGSNYPLTLTKARSLVTAGTTAGETYVEDLWRGSINVTVGTEYTDTYTGSTNPRYSLINLSSTTLYQSDVSESGTPSSVGNTALTKQ